MARRHGRTFIGTSGWVYESWRQHLYEGIPRNQWLRHASRSFDTLEINGSFYTQIKPATYQRWRGEVPAGFRFALKGHRFVTHYKRLLDVDRSIALLRDQAIGLGAALTCVVWQLPAHFEANPARLESFLDALAAWPEVRHAIELRHRSWFSEEVAQLLATARVANCLSDAPDFPMWREITTDLVYVRLHGHTRKYASRYSRTLLNRWADDARGWNREGRDVYIYLDNDAEGHAVTDAMALRELVDLPISVDALPSRALRASAR